MLGLRKMNGNDENIDKAELERSKAQFERILKISLIMGIVIISGFIVYFLFLPKQGYISFGLLNENKKAEDYPTEALVKDDIYFYVTVENHFGRDFAFYLKISKGDNDTKLSPSGSDKADLNKTTSKVTLKNNEEWTSKRLKISFLDIGSNQIIIVELWQVKENNQEEFWDILWLRLNITN